MHSELLAVSVRDLSKTFRLFAHPADRVRQFLSLGLGKHYTGFEALKSITFDIPKGETVGIIGRNGSGKSTLLQIVSGILKPSAGTIHVSGRVSALLELGAGFNPEFTGRENVYFQGALMGLSRAQMQDRFEDIAAFADIGPFIDQPVRMYSSGMYLRLAFAVAVSVDSDILIVDEALAVGDAGFRSRCYRRIGDLRDAGCTILFVSHDLDQIIQLCGRAILLDAGEQLFVGPPKETVKLFQQLLASPQSKKAIFRDQCIQGTVGDDAHPNSGIKHLNSSVQTNEDTAVPYEPNGALIEDVQLTDRVGRVASVLVTGQFYRCRFQAKFSDQAASVRAAILIKTVDGQRLGGAKTKFSMDARSGALGVAEFQFRCLLNPGAYVLSVAILASRAGVEYALHGIQGAVAFQVEVESESTAIGAVDFGIESSLKLISPDEVN